MTFAPVPAQLLSLRRDPEDLRLVHFLEQLPANGGATKQTPSTADLWSLWGYSDDEGIRLNGGRPGALQAPNQIRRALYKMTCPETTRPLALLDRGNLQPEGTLADRHSLARKTVLSELQDQRRVLTLGGGHDYGFPDAAGFLDWCFAKKVAAKPVVINFDAHLDVRPIDRGFHSGTPFRRLLAEFKDQMTFIEVGLQPQCNSTTHRKWAHSQGAILVDLADLRPQTGFSPPSSLPEKLERILQEQKVPRGAPLWLSVDIDAFASSSAPGCSQSFATGLVPDEVIASFDSLKSLVDIRGMGIYEVSPPLDSDDRTAKLAALLIHRLLFNWRGQ